MDINNLANQNIAKVGHSNYLFPHANRCSWGPRKINDIEMIYQVEGRGTYREENHLLNIGKNEVLFIPPDRKHVFSCSAIPESAISCIHFAPAGKIPDLMPLKINAAADPEILMLFKRVSIEYGNKDLLRQMLARKMVEELLVRIIIIRNEDPMPKNPQRIRSAVNYIKDNKNQNICRKNIADSIGVTSEYLNYLFKRNLSTTPMEYLNRLRIDQAKELLLANTWSISQIAYTIGYKDPLYFSRVFKKIEGVSPRKFRDIL